MSLEKEPAGAFNKAQRLIEFLEYISLSAFCKATFKIASESVLSESFRPAFFAIVAPNGAWERPYPLTTRLTVVTVLYRTGLP